MLFSQGLVVPMNAFLEALQFHSLSAPLRANILYIVPSIARCAARSRSICVWDAVERVLTVEHSQGLTKNFPPQ